MVQLLGWFALSVFTEFSRRSDRASLISTIEVLSNPLDRCGPENLSPPPPQVPEGYSVVWIIAALFFWPAVFWIRRRVSTLFQASGDIMDTYGAAEPLSQLQPQPFLLAQACPS